VSEASCYALPSIRGLCDGDGTFTLGPGESGTCVVRNTRLSTVVIEKECDPENTDITTVFTINLTGPGAFGDQTVMLVCGQSSAPLTVEADIEYDVSEEPAAGYIEPSIRGLCDGDGTFTIAPGTTGTCVVHNDREAVLPE
jgi:hypothetical protein